MARVLNEDEKSAMASDMITTENQRLLVDKIYKLIKAEHSCLISEDLFLVFSELLKKLGRDEAEIEKRLKHMESEVMNNGKKEYH